MKNVTNAEDINLVRRAREGDNTSFTRLVTNYTTRAYRIAFTILKNKYDAEDAVQEAFTTAYRSIKKLEKEEAFGSWLARIVTSRSYDVLRQRQRDKITITQEDPAPELEQVPSRFDSPEAVENSVDIRWAIDRLPADHRLVVTLRYTQDATTNEIATIMDRPAGTVRRILSESYRLLRLYLEEETHREV